MYLYCAQIEIGSGQICPSDITIDNTFTLFGNEVVPKIKKTFLYITNQNALSQTVADLHFSQDEAFEFLPPLNEKKDS